MREIINLHIGQAGVQIADPYWRLMCSEHNIDIDGTLIPPSRSDMYSRGDMCQQSYNMMENDLFGNCESVFQETPNGTYCSRSVFIDPDPDTMSRFMRYCDHGLYSKRCYLTSDDSSSNLFSRGHGMMFYALKSQIFDTIRRLLEASDNPEGFLVMCSLGGGTGSGLSVILMNLLQSYYRKLAQVQLTVFPTPQSSVVEPYNCGLHEFHMSDYKRAVLLVDNDALNHAVRLMRRPKTGFDAVNGLIAQLASNLTLCTRFEKYIQGKLGLRELQFLLSPTKHIRFATSAYSPISSNWASTFDKVDEIQLTGDCFSSNNQLITCDNLGIYPSLGTCAIFRGEIDYFKGRQGIANCMDKLPFKIASGFNMCVIPKHPCLLLDSGITKTKNSACLFSNNLGLISLWQNTYNNFKKMIDKRAFIHWYEKDGINLFDMKLALESLHCLIDEYYRMLIL